MKNVLEIIFLKLFVWFFNESWNILADISRNSTTAGVLIKSTLKKRIPNTYEMSVKISQNSAKLNSSKNTYQTIKCELSFLPGNSWKWDLVALFGLVSQYHRKLDFLFIFYKTSAGTAATWQLNLKATDHPARLH